MLMARNSCRYKFFRLAASCALDKYSIAGPYFCSNIFAIPVVISVSQAVSVWAVAVKEKKVKIKAAKKWTAVFLLQTDDVVFPDSIFKSKEIFNRIPKN